MTPTTFLRRRLKALLVTGYCWGVLPAWFVTLAFPIFKLRSV